MSAAILLCCVSFQAIISAYLLYSTLKTSVCKRNKQSKHKNHKKLLLLRFDELTKIKLNKIIFIKHSNAGTFCLLNLTKSFEKEDAIL